MSDSSRVRFAVPAIRFASDEIAAVYARKLEALLEAKESSNAPDASRHRELNDLLADNGSDLTVEIPPHLADVARAVLQACGRKASRLIDVVGRG